MTDQIKIIVSTMTGTAELVADEILESLQSNGLEAEIFATDTLGLDVFSDGDGFIICSSTYGQGEIPDNGQDFYDALEAQSPDLSHVRYGIFTLGDITYPDTFCNAGNLYDGIMNKLGAKRIGEILRHDASSGELPEDMAGEWTDNWIRQFQAVKAA